MMEEQQKAAEKQAEDLNKELKQEITELEQLSHTDDHLHVIQMFSSLYSILHNKISDVDEKSLKRALNLLKEQLNEKLIQTELKFVQKFAVDVTLDPDTAHPRLILSDDGKQVSDGDIKRNVPENPKRFDLYVIILAKQGFSSGRFYYEVQVKGKTEWDLGVARESINRKGKITLGSVNGYWTVVLRNENQYKAADSPSVSLSLRVKPEKVGVFVDYEEGLVSFYDVDSRSHIYSFTGQTFTDKLYPYFSPLLNEEGKNSKPLIITPVN
ncbi:zinc-binding protein A33-like [Megalobrama amblycephala]|uniref:zinc-binding protein A33-like n=1 Tax=Megalobrama amblycephala TaxID=75352 RepID=UPI00201456C1|nr:zinc-binding protein A33-like [Megalobrama amblycephala]